MSVSLVLRDDVAWYSTKKKYCFLSRDNALVDHD